jgi:hypothetical protein
MESACPSVLLQVSRSSIAILFSFMRELPHLLMLGCELVVIVRYDYNPQVFIVFNHWGVFFIRLYRDEGSFIVLRVSTERGLCIRNRVSRSWIDDCLGWLKAERALALKSKGGGRVSCIEGVSLVLRNGLLRISARSVNALYIFAFKFLCQHWLHDLFVLPIRVLLMIFFLRFEVVLAEVDLLLRVFKSPEAHRVKVWLLGFNVLWWS